MRSHSLLSGGSMIVRFGSLASGQTQEQWLKAEKLETFVPYEYLGEASAIDAWIGDIDHKLQEGRNNEAVILVTSLSGKTLGEELTLGEITKVFDTLASSDVHFYVYFG